jgi:hypothetical protein
MPKTICAAATLSLALLTGGCAKEHVTTTTARNRTAPEIARLDASDAERFGYAERDPTTSRPTLTERPTSRPTGEQRAASRERSSTGLSFKTPEQWTARGPGSMRVESFAVAGHTKLDCYISELGPGAGGLLLNVNRWRSQLGLSPISEAEANALPQWPVLGIQAKIVELESPDTERSMTVLAAFLEDRSVFVKMLGPTASVTAEKERFRVFCATLEVAR